MLIKQDFICTPVDKNRPLHIYLPDNYYESDEQYPVMYFFDGHNLFRDEDASFGTCWNLGGFLRNWDKPMIIVGIECGHEGRERLDEYSPYSFGGDYAGEVNGIGDDIFRWLTGELKPYIDGHLRTYYFREATGIGGSSMGGLMSLYGVSAYNRYFSKAACLSPTVIPCIDELCRDISGSGLDPDTRIWMSYGEAEARYKNKDAANVSETRTAVYNRRILELLDGKGVITRQYIQPHGRHCEADWAKQVDMFMDFLWKNR